MQDPASTASDHGTPSSQASGDSTQPSSFWKVRSSAPNHPPIRAEDAVGQGDEGDEGDQQRSDGDRDSATGQCPPAERVDGVARLLVADLAHVDLVGVPLRDALGVVLGVRRGVLSGHRILAISSEAGAFMTVAASRYSSGAPSSE